MQLNLIYVAVQNKAPPFNTGNYLISRSLARPARFVSGPCDATFNDARSLPNEIVSNYIKIFILHNIYSTALHKVYCMCMLNRLHARHPSSPESRMFSIRIYQ